MTTNAFAPTPTYTISGIGPYDAPFEYYSSDEITVSVLVDELLETVDPANYSVIPEGPTTSGTVFLDPGFASTYDGATMVLSRATSVNQTWVGLGSTAANLEVQLDEMARAIQENQAASATSLRVVSDALSPYEPQDGRVPYWDGALGSFVNGLNYADLEAGVALASTASDRVDVAVHAISGGKWRADVTTLVADVDLTYVVDQTSSVAEGDKIVTQAEGFGYSVAAETATDHHLETAGGVKLYVLPGTSGYNVKAFGALGDGVTDDSTAIQSALRHVGANATLTIPAGTYVITSTPEIPLSTSFSFLDIVAYGATFEITGAIAGLARERPTDIATTYTNSRISVRGLSVSGDNTANQHGFRFFTTYGLSLIDCHATQCDTGYLIVFGLMSSLERCFATNCATYGFRFASGGSQIDLGAGPETALTGGSPQNSNSNGSVAKTCRVFAAAGSAAHFKAEACEMEFANCITEGHSADNCFEYDNLGSTVSKGITIREPHVECTPGNAVYKLHTSTGTMGGTYLIEGQDTVITSAGWTGALFDLGANTPYCTIVMRANKTIYQVNALVKGANIAAWPNFNIDTANPDDWIDPSKWESGTVGNVTSVSPLINSANRMQDLATFNYAKNTGYFEWVTTHVWKLIAGHNVSFDFSGAGHRDFEITGMTTGGFILDGKFAYGEAQAGYTTPGTVVGRMPVYDETKTLVGYAPLYDSIT